MKVLKVIVDELPKGCNVCQFVDSYGNCVLVNRSPVYSTEHEDFAYYDYRPYWCPLILKKDILKYALVEEGYTPIVESEDK